MKSKILAAKNRSSRCTRNRLYHHYHRPCASWYPRHRRRQPGPEHHDAIESVAQTLKQIEQYQTQLQQYENQLQNTMAPAAYIWDQAQTTINRLIAAQNTLAYYENQLGSLDRYLAKFQDVAYYRSSPCFNGSGGCTPAEKAAMEENRRLASESQKKANDALFQTVADQQKALKDDARTLERLQGAAQGATGPATGHRLRQPARQPAGQSALADSHHVDRPTQRGGSPDCSRTRCRGAR